MKLAYKMESEYPSDYETSIEMVPYSSDFQEQYKKIYNECYHEMREALDIRPYDFIQDDGFFETGMDSVYLLLNRNEIIGSVTLNENEINDLIVNPEYQGQGYGRSILIWALCQLDREAVLHVAEWNKRAISLYEKTGFKITDMTVIKE